MKVTSRVSPSARSWKSEPGSKVKVPSLLLVTEPSAGELVMAKVWVSAESSSVSEKLAVTVLPSSVALMETAPATGRSLVPVTVTVTVASELVALSAPELSEAV